MILILYVVIIVAVTNAAEVAFTGYLIDIYCWDQPEHIGIDNARLGNSPEDHKVYCLRDIPACVNGGYAVLVEDDSISPYTYQIKYRLDSNGNELALAAIKATSKSKDFQVRDRNLYVYMYTNRKRSIKNIYILIY